MIMWLSETSTGTIILDITTIFLLTGMIVFTSLYRKRGFVSDRIYFCMIIADIVAALTDGLNYFFLESPLSSKGALITAGDTVFSIAFEVIMFMMVLFWDYRLREDKKHTVKFVKIAVWPCVLTIIMILGNLFGGYLFYFDKVSGSYVYAVWYDLIYVAVVIYVGIMLVQIFKKDKRTFIIFLLAIGCRILLRNVLRDVSSTPFIIAILLVFFHIQEMNENYYKEVEG